MHKRQLTNQNLTFAYLICFLPFLVTKESRVLEKNVNETQVSNTVFGHLKEGPRQDKTQTVTGEASGVYSASLREGCV